MDAGVVAAIIAGSVGVLTFVGTVFVQVHGIHRTSKDNEESRNQQREQLNRTLTEQRTELDRTLTEQRAQLDRTLTEQRTRTLNERFATAADKLGSDKSPAVRLAGVYAMAGLADDWPENRQTCIDVLCAYLRLPYEPDPGEAVPSAERLAFQADREVRHTVIRVIAAHLSRDVPGSRSWHDMHFDFTGVVFDGGDFTRVAFSDGIVRFDGASFASGEVDFGYAEFSGGLVYFDGAKFCGGKVDFTYAGFGSGMVNFDGATFSGGEVLFVGAQVSDGGHVSFNGATFSGGKVNFSHATVFGGRVYFGSAKFYGSTVDFSGARFSGGEVDFSFGVEFRGGTVNFSGAEFYGSEVGFIGAKFSGSTVNFSGAEFSGSTVTFRFPADWSEPPVFDWDGLPPARVELPSDADITPA